MILGHEELQDHFKQRDVTLSFYSDASGRTKLSAYLSDLKYLQRLVSFSVYESLKHNCFIHSGNFRVGIMNMFFSIFFFFFSPKSELED